MTASPQPLAPPGREGHVRPILALALPLIGGHLAQFAVGLTDTIMIGWYGVEELAALVLASSYHFTIFIMGSGFAWAVMPMVAAAAGTADDRQVRRVTRMGLWISILFGLAALPLYVWSMPILLALGQDPATAANAETYLRIISIGLIPSLLVMTLKSYLAALGRTQVVFWVMLGSAALNALLNWALIFGNWGAPELGIAGAAIASVILQVAGLLALMAYTRAATREYLLFQRFWRLDPQAFARVFRLGWPIGLTNLAEVGLFSASAFMMGWVGTTALAAHGIAITLASATFMFHLGLSNAATIRAGRAYGQRDERSLRDGALAIIVISLALALLTVAFFLAFPEPLVRLFLDPGDPAAPGIVVLGATLLALAALFQLADGAQVMALGLLRGVQDTKVPMVYAGLAYWAVGIPASYLLGFPLGWGAAGIWAGLVIGLVIAGALLMWRFWTRSVRIG
jgi:multidrug resistance protein, MATE family